MTVIKADKLCKLYKNGRGISDISFEVEEGDIVGLLGPNGSGKTTTMKIIVGLCKPQSGSLFIFGKQADENIHRLLKDIGVLIEAPAVFTDMTAEQNMKMAARYYDGVDAGRIDAVLDAVHLLSYKKEKAGKFSLGMKQRLGLALALLSNPKLLVLDEPTNGLDIEGMVEIREIIHSLNKKYGTTFLIASHLAAEVEKTCTKVAVMDEGKLISSTTMDKALELSPTLEDYFLRSVRSVRKDTLL